MRTLILISVALFGGCRTPATVERTVTVYPDGWTLTIEPGPMSCAENAEYDSFLGHKLKTDYPGSGGSFNDTQNAILERSIKNGSWRVYPYRDMNTDRTRRSQRIRSNVKFYYLITNF